MSAPDAGPATVIVAQPLSYAAFARYGHLIAPGEQQRDINFGTTRRFDDVAHLDTEAEGGRVGVAIFRTDAHTHSAPYPVRAFERHLLGSQSFVPMGAGRMLVVLAGSGARPDASAIVAFVVEAGQGVTLKRGVWHHPLITVGAADVLVIERMAATEDCEVVPLRARVQVVLAEG